MSLGARRPLAEAERIASAIVSALLPACERIEIAGSIRRRRAQVADIEIVAVPRFVAGPPTDLFAPPPRVSLLGVTLGELTASGYVTAHPARPASGDRYKRLWLPAAEMQCDLFLVLPPAEWGAILAIRTGPADYSQAAVTALRSHGLHCDRGAIWRGSDRLPCPDEAAFFGYAGMPYLEPARRGA